MKLFKSMIVSVSCVAAMLALPLSAFADTIEKVSSETLAIQSNETTNPNPGFSTQEKISEEIWNSCNKLLLRILLTR
ncbi:hypothetical protein [Paenibacillus spongiae]|uniref:Uncharacterized protein n=1 Tax=Paenibacillus spongiae TaxID=2909671 RepID=A0ABY5SH59_9BACL|nr:hypothetical protein [Paenibacillus spongiae]UVI33326.1 hypothetical protein L1F29_16425 [Paenibacillus spongiae]